MYADIYIYEPVHMCICFNVYTTECANVCMHTCAWTYVHVYIYGYMCIHMCSH